MPDQTPMVKDVMSVITVQGVITTSRSWGLLFYNVCVSVWWVFLAWRLNIWSNYVKLGCFGGCFWLSLQYSSVLLFYVGLLVYFSVRWVLCLSSTVFCLCFILLAPLSFIICISSSWNPCLIMLAPFRVPVSSLCSCVSVQVSFLFYFNDPLPLVLCNQFYFPCLIICH